MAANNFNFDWTNTLKPIGVDDPKKYNWNPKGEELFKTTSSVSDIGGYEKALELDLDTPSFASKGGKAAADSLKIGKDGAVGAKGMFADPEMLKGLQSSLSLFMAGFGLASGKGLLRKR